MDKKISLVVWTIIGILFMSVLTTGTTLITDTGISTIGSKLKLGDLFITKDPVIDIRWYGADGSDNIDDTTEIQNALDSVPYTGGKVLIPSGKFIISSALNISAKTSIIGNGLSSEIILSPNSNSNMLNINGDWIILRDFWLYGNKTGQSSGNCIYINSSDMTIVDNILIEECKEKGVYVTGSSNDKSSVFSIINTVLKGSDTGIFISPYAEDSMITNTYFENMDDVGMNIQGYGTKITNSHVYNSKKGVYIGYGDRTKIIGGMFETNQEEGIFIDNSIEVQVIGSTLFNNGKIINNPAIRLQGNSYRNIINDNLIYDSQSTKTQTYGIVMSSSSFNNFIGDNVIRDQKNGTYLDTGNNNTITDKNNGLYKIKDLLVLEPRSNAPLIPQKGEIYVDNDSNELCFYDGSSWNGLKSNGTCS